jgi:hypothetical protein
MVKTGFSSSYHIDGGGRRHNHDNPRPETAHSTWAGTQLQELTANEVHLQKRDHDRQGDRHAQILITSGRQTLNPRASRCIVICSVSSLHGEAD